MRPNKLHQGHLVKYLKKDSVSYIECNLPERPTSQISFTKSEIISRNSTWMSKNNVNILPNKLSSLANSVAHDGAPYQLMESLYIYVYAFSA